jgi:hypothetical protein
MGAIYTNDGFVIHIPFRPRRLLHQEALQLIVAGRGEITHRNGPHFKIECQSPSKSIRTKGQSRWTHKQILKNLVEAQKSFGRWHRYNSRAGDQLSHREFAEAYEVYERAVIRAIGAGLVDHKIVAAWIRARRSVGDYEALRRLRRGLEIGMPRSIDEADLWLAMEAAVPLEDGHSLPEIWPLLLRKAEEAEANLRPKLRSRLREIRNLRRRLARMGIRAAR